MNLKRTLISIFIVAIISVHAFPGIHLIYRETNKERTKELEYRISTPESGLIIEGYSENSKAKIFCDKQGNAYKAEYDLEKDVLIERERDKFIFIQDDKAVKKENADNVPWFGSYIYLKQFILSKDKEAEHYLIVPENMSVMKLKAIKERIERVKYGEKDIEAYRVRTTFPDWRGMFWSSHYWHRLDDGILIRAEETRGPPGTSPTIMELIFEENN